MQFANKNNSIIFLETGAGKTYVAILLIKSIFGEPIDRKFYTGVVPKENTKKCIFLVTTINLVDQQSEAISKATILNVKKLHSDTFIEEIPDPADP